MVRFLTSPVGTGLWCALWLLITIEVAFTSHWVDAGLFWFMAGSIAVLAMFAALLYWLKRRQDAIHH